MIAWWLTHPTPTIEALVVIFGEANIILSYCNQIGVWKQWRLASRGYVMVTSAESCRMREIEGVGNSGIGVCWQTVEDKW